MRKIYKYLIITLIVILSIHSAFTSPGFSSFEIFSQTVQNTFQYLKKFDLGIFFRFPPLVYLILNTLLKIMPHETTGFFYLLPIWSVFKAILFFNYISIFLSLKFFSKSLGKKENDVALNYFLSFSILLCITFLSFFELLAAPFLILCFAFLNKKKYMIGSTLFFVALLFNPYLVIFAPFIYLTFKQLIKDDKKKIIFRSVFLIVPIGIMLTYIYLIISQKPFLFETPIRLFGIPWFSMIVLQNISKIVRGIPNMPNIVALVLSSCSIIYFLTKSLFNILSKRKKMVISFGIILFLIIAGFILSFLTGDNIIYFYFIFIILYVFSLIKYRKDLSQKYNILKLYHYLYPVGFLFLIFFSEISSGNLGWLTIFALLNLQINTNMVNKIKLILTNVLVFIGLFIFWGINGKTPEIDPEYLSVFRIILSGIFISVGLWNFKNTFFLRIKNLSTKLKWILVGTIIVFGSSFVLSQGTVDVSIYNGMNKILVGYTNPFYAHPLIGNQYPPLSTVIYFSLTHIWNSTIGFQAANISNTIGNYAIPTKISGALLYFIFPLILLIFKKQFRVNKSLSKINLLVVTLTTFSLSLQSISLGDLDIYTVIPMFFAIILLTKNLSFLSGVVLGIAASLKWQPMLLVPIFIITLFSHKGDIYKSIKQVILFATGMIFVMASVWIPLLFQPEGILIFKRDFIGFFLGSPPYLSGQALNFDWIASYFFHIFDPTNYGVLDKNLNWCIGTTSVPKFFQGYLFYFVSAIIMIKYWFSYKKTLPYILSVILILFFSHHMLNKGAYENHFFYPVFFMLLLYTSLPTKTNRLLLILLDLMSFINQSLFYGITGARNIERLFFGFDITIFYSIFYLLVYFIVLKHYFKRKGVM